MDKIITILSGVNEESSAEELRRAIADALDETAAVTDDIKEYQRVIDELTESNANKDSEIARIKEENGRLFRERLADKTERATEAIEEKTDDEIIEELKANINI